jgi:hypothetical protein
MQIVHLRFGIAHKLQFQFGSPGSTG